MCQGSGQRSGKAGRSRGCGRALPSPLLGGGRGAHALHFSTWGLPRASWGHSPGPAVTPHPRQTVCRAQAGPGPVPSGGYPTACPPCPSSGSVAKSGLIAVPPSPARRALLSERQRRRGGAAQGLSGSASEREPLGPALGVGLAPPRARCRERFRRHARIPRTRGAPRSKVPPNLDQCNSAGGF